MQPSSWMPEYLLYHALQYLHYGFLYNVPYIDDPPEISVHASADYCYKASFAPNSRLIVYATKQGGREALMTTTLDGKIKARLAGKGGEIREPDWGPYQKY